MSGSHSPVILSANCVSLNLIEYCDDTAIPPEMSPLHSPTHQTLLSDTLLRWCQSDVTLQYSDSLPSPTNALESCSPISRPHSILSHTHQSPSPSPVPHTPVYNLCFSLEWMKRSLEASDPSFPVLHHIWIHLLLTTLKTT